jgi:hypothetical protein
VTVKDLIDRLRQFDTSLPVVIPGQGCDEEDMVSPTKVEVRRFNRDPDYPRVFGDPRYYGGGGMEEVEAVALGYD